ncbi:MAG: alpha/beta hydrolase [Chloroflexota bacterium]
MPFEFPMRGEIHKLNAEIRAEQPGEFISLSDGVTHFQIDGPGDGPLVVLVHGFSVPYFIWDPTFEALVEAGYRVLRYDLFGRGYSDRPFVRNDLELFDRQLVDLLDALNLPSVDALLGLSMGGVITANFTASHPERVRRIGLFDPAGFPAEYPFYIRLLLLPILGEIIFGSIGEKLFQKLAGNDFYDPRHIDVFFDQYRIQMQYKGFRRSLLSTMRSGILETGLPIYQAVGGLEIPAILVWGEHDHTVPFENSQSLIKAVPQAEFYPIANSGHIPHYENAVEVNPLLLEFLKK